MFMALSAAQERTDLLGRTVHKQRLRVCDRNKPQNGLHSKKRSRVPSMRSSVNKKALDQYVNFTEQREELVARHEENRKGEGKIRDLIQTLDLRKDEAVERTFKVGVVADVSHSSHAVP